LFVQAFPEPFKVSVSSSLKLVEVKSIFFLPTILQGQFLQIRRKLFVETFLSN